MATIKSYTDLEQSKKLEEILPIETADMIWVLANPDLPMIKAIAYKDSEKSKYYEILPAWSLAALFSIALLEELEDNHFLTLQKEKDEYCCCYEDINGNSFTHTFADNPIDACYEMIIKLNELNLL